MKKQVVSNSEIMRELYDFEEIGRLFRNKELSMAKGDLSMAKEVKEKQTLTAAYDGAECSEVQLGQAIQIGVTAITHLNANHAPQKAKLESGIYHTANGVEFKFDGKVCLIPMSVVKLIIYA